MKKETWYCWREYVKVEGEKRRRLIVPWADPFAYEFPFDFIYKTKKAAKQGKIDHGAENESWILCRMTLEPTS